MRRSGFTLTEVLVALAVSSILLSSAVPGFQGMLLNSRRAAVINDLVTSIQLARAESLKRRSVATICPSSDGLTCSGGADWSGGWLVYANRDQLYAGVEPDAGETVMRYTANIGTSVRIIAGGRSHFSFRAFDINSDNGTITVCDPRALATAGERRAIIISTTGRPRISTRTWDGDELSCS